MEVIEGRGGRPCIDRAGGGGARRRTLMPMTEEPVTMGRVVCWTGAAPAERAAKEGRAAERAPTDRQDRQDRPSEHRGHGTERGGRQTHGQVSPRASWCWPLWLSTPRARGTATAAATAAAGVLASASAGGGGRCGVGAAPRFSLVPPRPRWNPSRVLRHERCWSAAAGRWRRAAPGPARAPWRRGTGAEGLASLAGLHPPSASAPGGHGRLHWCVSQPGCSLPNAAA